MQPSASVLEYDDSKGSQHWRFYVGDVEGLDSVLRDLRFGDAAKGFIAVCNVHMFIVARHDKALASAIHSASFAVCDGQPIAWLAGMVASRPVQRITGPQILHRVLLDGKGPPRIALIGGNRDCLNEDRKNPPSRQRQKTACHRSWYRATNRHTRRIYLGEAQEICPGHCIRSSWLPKTGEVGGCSCSARTEHVHWSWSWV